MEKKRFAGRHLLVWGALLLLAWMGYEFWVRVQTIWWAFQGLYRLCVAEQIPFQRALSYFDPSMYAIVGYLLACFLFAIVCICLRNRPNAGYVLILIALGLGWFALYQLGWAAFGLNNWLQSLKLIPLLLIIVGCVANLASFYARKASHARRRGRDEGEDDAEPSHRAGRDAEPTRKAQRPPKKGSWNDVYDELDLSDDERDTRARELAGMVKDRRRHRAEG